MSNNQNTGFGGGFGSGFGGFGQNNAPAGLGGQGGFGVPAQGAGGQFPGPNETLQLVLEARTAIPAAVAGSTSIGRFLFDGGDGGARGAAKPRIQIDRAAPLDIPDVPGLTWAMLPKEHGQGDEPKVIFWTLREPEEARSGRRSRVAVGDGRWVQATSSLPHGPGQRPLVLTLQDDKSLSLMVRLEAEQYTVIDLHDIIAEHLLLLRDGDDGQLAPDYPLDWRWLRVLTKVSSKPGRHGNSAQELRYGLHIRGIPGEVHATFGTSAVMRGFETGSNATAFDCLLWPGRRMKPGWAYYVSQIGNPSDEWAEGKTTWALLYDSAGNSQPSDFAACEEQAQDGRPSRRIVERKSSDSLVDRGTASRVVTRQCPDLLALRIEQASGCFALRIPTLVDGSGLIAAEKLSLDLGTSNTCMAAQTMGPAGEVLKPVLINFNQRPPQHGDERRQATVCSVLRRQHPSEGMYSHFPWMPGMEAGAESGRIDQVSSRIMIMPRLTGYPIKASLLALTEDAVDRALPLCDVTIPPDGFAESKPNLAGVCYDKLKWLDANDPLARPMLRRFIESLLLLACAGLDLSRANLSIAASYPLAFRLESRGILEKALKEAARAVSEFTGIAISADLASDEATSLISQYSADAPSGVRVRLTAVCDIGGGSVDFAARMEQLGTQHVQNNGCYLINDSIRFGANLVFNALVQHGIAERAFPPEKFVGKDEAERSNLARELLRRFLRREGYRGLLRTGKEARLTDGDRRKVLFFIRLYHGLVLEYFARTIAGALRNPLRMPLALQHAIALETDRVAPSYPPEQILKMWSNFSQRAGVEIVTILTGNGWRMFDAIDGQGSFGEIATRSSDIVRQRIGELLVQPIELEPESVASAYAHGLTNMPMTPQIGWRNKPEHLKESLALAILESKQQSGSTDGNMTASLELTRCAINGITEVRKDYDWENFTDVTVASPWYAVVTARPEVLVWSQKRHSLQSLPTTHEPWAQWYNDARSIRRVDKLQPKMAKQVVGLGEQDGKQLDLTLDSAYFSATQTRGLEEELADPNGQRQRSALGMIYERGYARVFDPTW